MGTCKLCNQDMLEVESCINRRLVFSGPHPGVIARFENAPDLEKPVPYGEESEYWDDEPATGTCHDCGVAVGEFHHAGCDMEECPNPVCNDQQLVFCGCDPHVLTRAEE